ncbi:toxin Fic [Clostridia bacterium]|nr:toxin Fic [Clostridia bacterium]
MSEKNDAKRVVRSSAAEYLTFVASTGDDSQSVEMRYEDENIWLTQKMMAELYGVSVAAISQHIKTLRESGEIDDSVIKKYLITADDGKSYKTNHYSLQTVISVGFKIENDRAVQFRKWAREIVKNYTIQGWDMNDERLKQAFRFDKEFFARQLERIREIRLSERMFYQKVTDLYATAFDYDNTAKTTTDFYKKVQNKLHWAVHKHTAAELIYERADANKQNMGLMGWENGPDGKIKKSDVTIAKNYLDVDELRALGQIVEGYLTFAERQAERNVPMTMEDWAKHLDRILVADGNELLKNAGRISTEIARDYAETQFEKYRVVQDRVFKSDYDRLMEGMEKGR